MRTENLDVYKSVTRLDGINPWQMFVAWLESERDRETAALVKALPDTMQVTQGRVQILSELTEIIKTAGDTIREADRIEAGSPLGN
jgi:hypothetical protein